MEPKIIQIEATDFCSGACAYCPTGVEKHLKIRGDLSHALLEKAASLLKFSQSNICWVHHSGEPFLYQHLPYLISKVKNAGKRVALSTNLINISKGKVVDAFDSGLDRMEIHLSGFLSRKTILEIIPSLELVFKIKLIWNFPVSIGINYGLAPTETEESVIETFKYFDVLQQMREYHICFYRPHDWVKMSEEVPTEVDVTNCDFIKHNGVSVLSNGSIVRCCLDVWGKSAIMNILEVQSIDEIKVLNNLCSFCSSPQNYFESDGVV